MSIDVFYVEEKQILRGFDPMIFKILICVTRNSR